MGMVTFRESHGRASSWSCLSWDRKCVQEPAEDRVCVREHFGRRSEIQEVSVETGQEQSLRGRVCSA